MQIVHVHDFVFLFGRRAQLAEERKCLHNKLLGESHRLCALWCPLCLTLSTVFGSNSSFYLLSSRGVMRHNTEFRMLLKFEGLSAINSMPSHWCWAWFWGQYSTGVACAIIFMIFHITCGCQAVRTQCRTSWYGALQAPPYTPLSSRGAWRNVKMGAYTSGCAGDCEQCPGLSSCPNKSQLRGPTQPKQSLCILLLLYPAWMFRIKKRMSLGCSFLMSLMASAYIIDLQGQSRHNLSKKSMCYDATVMLSWPMSSGTACTRHGPVSQSWHWQQKEHRDLCTAA